MHEGIAAVFFKEPFDESRIHDVRLVGAEKVDWRQHFLKGLKVVGNEAALPVCQEDKGKVAAAFNAHNFAHSGEDQTRAGVEGNPVEGFLGRSAQQVGDLLFLPGLVAVELRFAYSVLQLIGVDGLEQVVYRVVAESADGEVIVSSGKNHPERDRRNLVEQVEAGAILHLYIQQEQVDGFALEQVPGFGNAACLADDIGVGAIVAQ